VVEGAQTQGGMGRSLAAFLDRGMAAWIRQPQNRNAHTATHGDGEKPEASGPPPEALATLFANLFEPKIMGNHEGALN